MILLAGPTGSGKTTIAKSLEKLGYNIIPTYTTREPRPNDAFTECITFDEFKSMLSMNKFVAGHTFKASFGNVSYGIPKVPEEDSSNSVVIIAYEYFEDLKKYLRIIDDTIFLVYLHVPDNIIISRSMTDDSRGESNKDLLFRLERDYHKNQVLREKANLLISNSEPGFVAKNISREYQNFLNKRLFKKLKERGR